MVLIAWVLCLVSCSSDPIPVDLLVENVTVYSGSSSEPFMAAVTVRDGRFVSVGRLDHSSVRANVVIDGTGLFMIPGLWDAHAHVRSSKKRGLDVTKFLEYGVTSIHDLGGYLERLKTVEAEIAGGITPGPQLYPSYFMLNGTSFADYQRPVLTEADIDTAIHDLISAGAVQIKIHRALSPELLAKVVELAHTHDLRVTGHIPLGLHPLDACEIGMDSVEHVGSLAEALISVSTDDDKSARAALDYLLSESANPIYECLAERKVIVTPTLLIYPTIARRRAGGEELPPEFVDFIEAVKLVTARLHQSGVMLLAGTDVSDLNDPQDIEPGISLHRELLLLEEAGVPAVEIIAMASLNAARAIGVDDETGSIDAGKNADFLLLSADPGQSIQNIGSIVAVFQMGRKVFDPTEDQRPGRSE